MSRRVRVGERGKQDGVKRAEHRHRAADADRERRDRDR